LEKYISALESTDHRLLASFLCLRCLRGGDSISIVPFVFANLENAALDFSTDGIISLRKYWGTSIEIN